MGSRSGMAYIEDIQEIETHRFLYRILERPDKFLDYLRAFVSFFSTSSCLFLLISTLYSVPSAVMLKIAYDYNIASDGPDDLVELADMLVKTIFSEASQAGRWLVDIIPARMSLPLLRSPRAASLTPVLQ